MGSKIIDDGVDRKKQVRAIVLHPELKKGSQSTRSSEARLEEAYGLALAIDLEIIRHEVITVARPKPSTLFGSGIIDKYHDYIHENEVEVVIVDTALTPVQQRNLEKGWEAKVIDRTGLILEIFGERARTKEGKLQVDLAQLSYQRSRLVRSWTHLERQRGGAGFMGGPGERQIEIDRRLIDEKIVRLKSDLEMVKKTRELHRSARRKVPFPIVSLVGYTNAGKSTLFNRLTESKVFAEDLLFATLDPTMRRVNLPSGREIILSDTVGFISELPTDLIASFRATLEEVREANVLVHVRDVSHEDTEAQKDDVKAVLNDLELDPDIQKNMIEVWNKSDLLSDEIKSSLEIQSGHQDTTLLCSAITGEGCSEFLHMVEQLLDAQNLVYEFEIPYENGAALSWLHDNAKVLEQDHHEEGVWVSLSILQADADKFISKFAINPLEEEPEV
ncbi:GTPase HflX [Kiloniella litopenaei]|uniref:GTPase HflX n=1 Tax=Kiloniella litopenaei TaxID=1549748 RepID=A0A0M2R1F7_9PROT|nr:GTPase HflX [Kiloniella litopenaei]KKJ75481.1 GTPase HflX [Kiloniella litopenaei]